MTGLVIFAVVLSVIAFFVIIGLTRAGGARAGFLALIVSVVIISSLVGYNYMTTYRNDRWVTCHITGKDRGAQNGTYRVYTSDCGQLANHDTYLRGKFRSADLWQKIPNQGVVRLRIAGTRFGPLSMFPNIFDVQEVNKS